MDTLPATIRCRTAFRLLALVLCWCAAAGAARADDAPAVRVTFTDKDKTPRTVAGRIVVEARDGGILLLGCDGRLWNITPERLQRRAATGAKFAPLSADELGPLLLDEFGQGFEIVTTRHYIICTNAGTAYGRWCGALFERLLGAFRTHWRTRALDLHDSELPLVAVVFADARQFARFAAADVGPAVANAKGYYSARSNRMVLYDLTAGDGGRPAESAAEVNRRIAAASFNVATIVHEATHQIAFNCGLHNRYADNPLWLTEGMAMYFETPDLSSQGGWRTVGRVNSARLARFRDFTRKRRNADSLRTLLSGNERFADPETTRDAYAQAWALSYFLIKTRRKEYVDYLDRLSRKPPLVWDDSRQRLNDFRAAFGDDLQQLEQRFLRYMARLRR